MLYLMKLYNGKDFGTRAGAYWRILFVLGERTDTNAKLEKKGFLTCQFLR